MLRICKSCGATFNGSNFAVKCPDCVLKERSSTIRDRECVQCGRTFPGGPRARYCPECRAERKKEQYRQYHQRKRAGTVRKIGSTDMCIICGQPYTVESGTQHYCPSCAEEAVRAIDRAQSRQWNAAHLTPDARRADRHAFAAPLICCVCGKSFIPDPSRANATTCSPSCSSALARSRNAEWERENKDSRLEYHRNLRNAKIQAMTPDELSEYRSRVNANARENYRKRKGNQT